MGNAKGTTKGTGPPRTLVEAREMMVAAINHLHSKGFSVHGYDDGSIVISCNDNGVTGQTIIFCREEQ